jgi:4-amino-4-deoxy-L-arabinose transferase-like glycosyltransferase
LALAAIAFWDLAGRSIFHRDVTRFATIAAEMLRSRDWLVPTHFGMTYANKPILYIWCVALGSLVPGDPTAFTLRLPSALALVATGWATALWGRARSGSVAVGRLAGLLAITTYSLHELGRTGRPDMLSTAFATIAAALVDRALLGKAGPRAWIGIGLALGGGFLSKGPVVLLVPVALVFLPRAGTTLGVRWRRARLDFAFGLGVVLAAAWVVPAGLHGGWGYVKRLVFDQVGDRMRGESNHKEAFWHYLVAAPLAWLPWSPIFFGTAIAACTAKGRALLGSASHLGAALVALVVLSAVPTKEIRYAAFLVPPLAVAAAQFADGWGRRGRDDDAPSSARVHLVIAGSLAMLAALASAWAEWLWPSTALWLVPLSLVVLVAGAGAVRLGRSALPTRAVRGRAVGLAVVVAACGICAFWVILGRYLPVHTAAAENDAVAFALDRTVPTVVVGSAGTEGLNPDEFFEAYPAALFARTVRDLDPTTLPNSIQLVALAADRDAIEDRIGHAQLLLERPRADGRTLVVLRWNR